MKQTISTRFGLAASTLAVTFSMTMVPTAAVATRAGVEAPTTTAATSTASDTKNQAKLKLIISRGDKEINRRLKTLNTLSVKINGAKKLSSADKTSLSAEVQDEISSLNALKAKLDADTDLAAAQADAQSIFSAYRVYALIVPKVQLVKAADDQQAAENKLTDLAAKLKARLSEAQKKGKDTANLQSTLDNMTTKTTAAQVISSGVEAAVIALQPNDYNSNHGILSGNRDKLKAAQDNIKTAATDAKTIVTGLRKL